MLIELTIAIAIFAMTVMTSLTSIYSMQHFVQQSSILRTNMYAAHNILEYSLAYRTATSSAGTFASTSIHYETPCLFTVMAASGSFSISSLLFDTNSAANIGNDCNGYVGDIWHPPHTSLSSVAITASGTIQAIDALGQTIAVGGISNATSSPTLTFLNSKTLQIYSTLVTQNINGLDLAGNYLYIATQGTSSQFSIVDVTDATKPKIIATRTLPGVTGSYPSGLSIAYYNSKIYIGTHRTAGNEFHIYDVSSPTNPKWLGSIELNHNINDISIKEPYAFLATSGNTNHVIVLDISNPSSPVKIGSFVFPGQEDATSIVSINNELYVGRKKSSPASALDSSLIRLDATDPKNLIMLASTSLPADINNIKVSGPSVFLSTSQGVYRIARIFSGLQKITTTAGFIDIQDEIVYSASTTGLSILSP